MSVVESIWRQAILPPTSTVQQAILNLNQVSIKIVLVANEADELQGTISDGDIRRGLLRGRRRGGRRERLGGECAAWAARSAAGLGRQVAQ